MSSVNRRKFVLKLAKGYTGRHKNCYNIARNRVEKALQYSYRDRRTKKREARRTWITQISAASRAYAIPYADLMHGLSEQHMLLNRKMLATIAVTEPLSFRAVTKAALPDYEPSRPTIRTVETVPLEELPAPAARLTEQAMSGL